MVTKYKIDNYMKLSMEEIDAKLAEQHDILQKIWEEDDGSSWERYREKCQEHWDETECLNIAKTMLLDKETSRKEALNKIGDIFSVKEFKQACECHAFMNSDGFGYYADDSFEYIDIEAEPRAFELGYIRPDFEKVIWYNK